MLIFCDFIQVNVYTHVPQITTLKHYGQNMCGLLSSVPGFSPLFERNRGWYNFYSHESYTRPTRCTLVALGFKRVKWG